MWASLHERRTTPRQQAVYNAHPYHFRIHYTHRWSGGFGNGVLDWGQNQPVFTAAYRDDFVKRVAMITAANVQADGVTFDPATLSVEITEVIPLNDHTGPKG